MIVKIENLTKKYKDFKALDNFSLEVKKGEILGLLGPNGSGKTTTINCLLSLLSYDSGSVEIFGMPMNENAYDIKKDIGLVMQNVAVFDELNVKQNIDYFCGLYIKDSKERKVLVEEAIAFVGLEDVCRKYPKQLSGGLLRRLNIACGIAHKPKLIILDEPTVAVDPQSRNYILENIKRLNELGATIIYTTHYMEEVEQICSRIVIMDNGKEIANGSKEELKTLTKIKEKIILEIDNFESEYLDEIKSFDSIGNVIYTDNVLEIEVIKDSDMLLKVLKYFNDNNITYNNLSNKTPTLNDVFLELTGKALRD